MIDIQSTFRRILLTAIFAITLCASLAVKSSAAADLARDELPMSEVLRLGERMYRDGILPSGQVMKAFIREDVAIDSTAFSCASCHLRAGLGSVEGGIVTPPTTGNKLYLPYRRPPSLNDIPDKERRVIYAKTVQERPAYNRKTLATALRFGIDPAGQVFNDVMPRYSLADRDMEILILYLEKLSAAPSPGASSTEYRFATIISDDVSESDRQALLHPLQSIIAQKNQQLALYKDFIKFGYEPTVDMKYSFRRVDLDIWELRGPSESWPSQLAAYYARNPVFAVLGGISNSDWQPIHDFCEKEHLPCLFPITRFPPLMANGWYSFYFEKGYVQEGEAVARYLNQQEPGTAAKTILEIIQDVPDGRALAVGFHNSWRELDKPPITSVTLSKEQLLQPATVATLLKKHKPAVLLLWTDAALIPYLEKLITEPDAPAEIFLSSSWLGKEAVTIATAVRQRVFLTYPYRLTPYVGPKTGGIDSRIPILASARDFGDRRIASRTISALQQAIMPNLILLNDNLQRDNLLDVMGMQMDLIVKDYERLSFGPGQRFASKGCYVIQLGPGAEPELIPRSGWLTH